jgi:Kre9/KNH-like N-terminal Ig-like domain
LGKKHWEEREEFMKRGMFSMVLVVSMWLFCLSCSTGDLPDKGIAILSPKANDVVQQGAPYEIQWKTEVPESEFGAMVSIEFSKDAGKSWELIEDNVPNTGKYEWKRPKTASAQSKIRVFSQRRPEYRGTSAMFVVK